MTTFVALSTHNYQQNGYSVLATGNDKNEVEQAAQQHINENESGAYRDTYHRNLIVVTKTTAKRRYNVKI